MWVVLDPAQNNTEVEMAKLHWLALIVTMFSLPIFAAQQTSSMPSEGMGGTLAARKWMAKHKRQLKRSAQHNAHPKLPVMSVEDIRNLLERIEHEDLSNEAIYDALVSKKLYLNILNQAVDQDASNSPARRRAKVRLTLQASLLPRAQRDVALSLSQDQVQQLILVYLLKPNGVDELVHYYVWRGFDIDAPIIFRGRFYGDTLLHVAVHSNSLFVAKILLQNGASLEQRNGIGLTPEGLAAHLPGREEMLSLIRNEARLRQAPTGAITMAIGHIVAPERAWFSPRIMRFLGFTSSHQTPSQHPWRP
jgi:hypothetical protein